MTVIVVMPTRGGAARRGSMEPLGASSTLGGVETVVRAAQRGDPAAIDALVRELSPYVGRICGAIALEDGEDAMQETLIAVVRNIGTLREPAAVRGWARRIAVRESVRVAQRRTTGVELPASLAAADVDVDTVLDVESVLASMSPAQRAVLVLRDLDGMPEADVAALLAIPEGTVKSRLHRARSAFATRWER